jgi:hypothetical protein
MNAYSIYKDMSSYILVYMYMKFITFVISYSQIYLSNFILK